MNTHHKILVDLKPALDGYAGIPQEARYLFKNLRELSDQFEVDGLLQHGTGALVINDAKSYPDLPEDQKMMQDSQLVGTLATGIVKQIIPRLPAPLQERMYRQLLLWQAFTEKPSILGMFQSGRFDDFLWRTLFSKALPITAKPLVCAARFRMLEPSRQHMHNLQLGGLKLVPTQNYLRVDTIDYDAFISQTPFPGRVSKNTKLVIRYHDAVPIMMPHTIADRGQHQSMHYKALRANVKAGAYFSCISKATQSDLISLFPEAEERSTVIYNSVGAGFKSGTETAENAWEIICNRAIHTAAHEDNGKQNSPAIRNRASKHRYLLMVSTIEPRKNHELLLSAWEKLHSLDPDLKLVLTGARGWQSDAVYNRMLPWIKRGHLHHVHNVPIHELRVLYQHAAATICPSLFEGFDYSGVEAMCSGGCVISSDIPVHREVFGNASVYFDPHDAEHAALVMQQLLFGDKAEAKMAQLKKRNAGIAKKYSGSSNQKSWKQYLQKILA